MYHALTKAEKSSSEQGRHLWLPSRNLCRMVGSPAGPPEGGRARLGLPWAGHRVLEAEAVLSAVTGRLCRVVGGQCVTYLSSRCTASAVYTA